MLLRLYAAIDTGLRAGELMQIQLKHLEFGVKVRLDSGGEIDAVRFTLPPSVTKGGKSTGQDEIVWAMTPRLIEALERRRFVGSDGYVFGSPAGTKQREFEWARLFRLAGLTPGRTGVQWHDLRHEFASYLIDCGASSDDVRRLARHRDYRTTEKYIQREEQVLAQRAALMATRGSAS